MIITFGKRNGLKQESELWNSAIGAKTENTPGDRGAQEGGLCGAYTAIKYWKVRMKTAPTGL